MCGSFCRPAVLQDCLLLRDPSRRCQLVVGRLMLDSLWIQHKSSLSFFQICFAMYNHQPPRSSGSVNVQLSKNISWHAQYQNCSNFFFFSFFKFRHARRADRHFFIHVLMGFFFGGGEVQKQAVNNSNISSPHKADICVSKPSPSHTQYKSRIMIIWDSSYLINGSPLVSLLLAWISPHLHLRDIYCMSSSSVINLL